LKKGIGIILFCLYSIVFGQSPYLTTTKTYTTENGLAGRFANYTFKDSWGIIWMGTQHGLHRFDGRDLRVFGEEEGLPFQEVMEIYEDAEGYLWLYRSCFSKNEDYCTKNLTFFHAITHEVLSPEERFGSDIPFKSEEIERLVASLDNSRVGICTGKASYIWTQADGFKRLPANEFTDHPRLFTILADGRMGAWEQTEDAFIYYLLGKDGELLHSEVLSSEQKPFSDFFTYPYNGPKRLNFQHVILFVQGDNFEIFQVNDEGRLEKNAELVEQFKVAGLGARHNYFDETYQTLWSADRAGIVGTYFQKNKFKYVLADNDSKMLWGVYDLGEKEYLFTKAGDGTFFYHFNMYGEGEKVLKNLRLLDHRFPTIGKEELRDALGLYPVFEGKLLVLTKERELKSLDLTELSSGASMKLSNESFFVRKWL
jgi:hypothetical protein